MLRVRFLLSLLTRSENYQLLRFPDRIFGLLINGPVRLRCTVFRSFGELFALRTASYLSLHAGHAQRRVASNNQREGIGKRYSQTYAKSNRYDMRHHLRSTNQHKHLKRNLAVVWCDLKTALHTKMICVQDRERVVQRGR